MMATGSWSMMERMDVSETGRERGERKREGREKGRLDKRGGRREGEKGVE